MTQEGKTNVSASVMVMRIRERLSQMQRRAVGAMRAAENQCMEPEQKTKDIMARVIKIDTYADTLQLILLKLEESAQNDIDMKALDEIERELNQIGSAVRQWITPGLPARPGLQGAEAAESEPVTKTVEPAAPAPS